MTIRILSLAALLLLVLLLATPSDAHSSSPYGRYPSRSRPHHPRKESHPRYPRFTRRPRPHPRPHPRYRPHPRPRYPPHRRPRHTRRPRPHYTRHPRPPSHTKKPRPTHPPERPPKHRYPHPYPYPEPSKPSRRPRPSKKPKASKSPSPVPRVELPPRDDMPDTGMPEDMDIEDSPCGPEQFDLFFSCNCYFLSVFGRSALLPDTVIEPELLAGAVETCTETFGELTVTQQACVTISDSTEFDRDEAIEGMDRFRDECAPVDP